MPICIECRTPVRTLWTQYSGAGDPSSGHNIRLTVCRTCGRFCDKYVEHDFVVLFIDLVLIKPQVYRHLLHNTLMRDCDQFDPSIIRLGTLLLLFDVYLTWARIEKQTTPIDSPASAWPSSEADSSNVVASSTNGLGALAHQPIVFQYLFFLILCAFSTLAFHLSIRALASSPWSPLILLGWLPTHPTNPVRGAAPASSLPPGAKPAAAGASATGPASSTSPASASPPGAIAAPASASAPTAAATVASKPAEGTSASATAATGRALPRPNSVSTALLVSSSTKLFPILMVIWDYDVPAAARSLGWAVVANNVEALKILLDCGYLPAVVLAAAGAIARWLVGRAVLRLVGLEWASFVDGAGDVGIAVGGGGGGSAGGGSTGGLDAVWAGLAFFREWAGRLAVG